ncbi:diguanylate cyclase domain-containing protein [Paenibacillus sp. SGZ-1009]|uniref:diguanylate cyclase domain-containing protein n=1 Tax=Paenibacillus campi TaxID=3106031 RepID=UPI002AFDE922|nr:diguanylate cyclase [Paenibacillus sp. SGZ-1009]
MEFSNEFLTMHGNGAELRFLIDMIPELIVLKDGQGRWLLCNRLVQEIHHLNESQYRHKTDLELAELRPTLRDIFEYNHMTDEQAWEKGSTLVVEKSFVAYNGTRYIWEVIKTPIFNKQGGRDRLVAVSRNITDRRLMERQLYESQERFRFIAENMTDIVTIFTMDGKIDYLSPSLEHMLGYKIEVAMNQPRFVLLHPDDVARLSSVLGAIFAREMMQAKVECRYRHAQGHYIWFEMSISHVSHDDGEQYVLIVGRDITERKQHEQQLNSLAYMDALTGVPNRRYLMKQLEQDIGMAREHKTLVGVLYLDVDRFKQVNDTLGHEQGDQLLVQMVARITAELGPMDTIARIGGDEFIVILPIMTDRNQIAWLAQTLCDVLKQPWQLGGRSVMTSSSIGISIYPHDSASAFELIRHADVALYESKRTGKARFTFYEDMPKCE